MIAHRNSNPNVSLCPILTRILNYLICLYLTARRSAIYQHHTHHRRTQLMQFPAAQPRGSARWCLAEILSGKIFQTCRSTLCPLLRNAAWSAAKNRNASSSCLSPRQMSTRGRAIAGSRKTSNPQPYSADLPAVSAVVSVLLHKLPLECVGQAQISFVPITFILDGTVRNNTQVLLIHIYFFC